MIRYGHIPVVPPTKQTTCRICYLTDNTGFTCPSDMDFNFHDGFTIGKGKTLYWTIVWHRTGNCTVYSKDGSSPRYISGDQIIVLHFL